jgi:hypothetical protein
MEGAAMNNGHPTIEAGKADQIGRRQVVVRFNGGAFPDRFDVSDAWQRGKWRGRVVDHFAFNNGEADEWLESELMRKVGEQDREAERTIEPVLRRMSDVQPEPISWLWPARIALGKLTLIAGDPGLGKSLVSLDIASRVSTGSPLPDGSGDAPRGGVLLVSCEDDAADTIRPRLDGADADCDHVSILDGIRWQSESGDDDLLPIDLTVNVAEIADAIESVPNCRLLVVDPLTAYLGSTDSHKNAEVRRVLAGLAALASRTGVSVLCVTHLNKGTGPAIYRTMGSLAFIAATRAAWAVTRDRDNDSRRLLLPLKNNLARDSSGLAFTIVGGTNEPPRVAWESGAVSVNVDDALSIERREPGRPPDEFKQAEQWLRDRLAGGPQSAKDTEQVAHHEACISKRTLERARKSLGVVAYRAEIPGPWYWKLPDGNTAKT